MFIWSIVALNEQFISIKEVKRHTLVFLSSYRITLKKLTRIELHFILKLKVGHIGK